MRNGGKYLMDRMKNFWISEIDNNSDTWYPFNRNQAIIEARMYRRAYQSDLHP